MTLNKTNRIVLTDTFSLLGLFILSLVLQALTHIPPAISFIQIISVELFVLTLPLTVLSTETNSTKRRNLNPRQLRVEIGLFSLLAILVSYGNYLLFFARHGLSPAYMDSGHPAHLQATALTCLTIALCQLANLLLVRADEHPKFFAAHLKSSRKLLQALAVSGFLVLNVIYNPWLQAAFGTYALDISDVSAAIFGLGLFIGLRSLQRHTRQHARHAVVALHRETEGEG
jgi:magnesium-transporting ATPase (P-type)